ncbi:MAG: hypothetical protein FJ279_19150 [Planctomycetes bacterium]|nr:hypothetical protein [Planctomycetota bacterium]MBM4078341.1 hypothetical protein [Planctomycetota bacterium]
MSTKQQVAHELDSLSEGELEMVAEYVGYLKFRARMKRVPALDERQLAALYAEFAAEDRQFAEEGMSDYAGGLVKEDSP